MSSKETRYTDQVSSASMNCHVMIIHVKEWKEASGSSSNSKRFTTKCQVESFMKTPLGQSLHLHFLSKMGERSCGP